MKGERTLDDKPFRYGGFWHNYDRTTEEWAEFIPQMRKCYICGGKMGNIYSPAGTLLKKTYPYVGMFHITKGENKGKSKFRPMCRACAYAFGRGVIEMDGHTYKDKNEFSENKFKADLKRGICWNCNHLRKHNGDMAEWVCERKGSVVNDTRIRNCDEMWEGERNERTDDTGRNEG